MLLLVLYLLDHVLHLSRLHVINTKVILVLLVSTAHAIECFAQLAALIGDQGLREETFSACVIVAAKLGLEPRKDVPEVDLCLLVEDKGNLVLSVLHHEQVVFDDEILPDLNDLLEESLRVLKLARLLKQQSHVVVALAEVDVFGAVLLALHVDTLRQLLDGVGVRIRSVLGHEEASKGQVERSMVAFELLWGHCRLISTAAIFATWTACLKQVPVCRDQELLCFLELCTTHANVCLSQDEVGREQLDRFLVKDLSLDRLAHFVIDVLVCLLVLLVDYVLLRTLDRSVDFLFLNEIRERQRVSLACQIWWPCLEGDNLRLSAA